MSGNRLATGSPPTPAPTRILERESGDIVGSIGEAGHVAGEFTFPHTVVTDSDGNLYAAETSAAGGTRNSPW